LRIVLLQAGRVELGDEVGDGLRVDPLDGLVPEAGEKSSERYPIGLGGSLGDVDAGSAARTARRFFRLKTFRSIDACTGAGVHTAGSAREATRDWRARNRERVNAERREAYREQHPLPVRACVICGRLFAKRADALVCGRERRRQRKLERDRAGRAAQ
jgi:hypothetical protein